MSSNVLAKLASKLKKTSASAGGNYIQEGRHKLRCRLAQFKDDRNDNQMLVADFEVLETNSDLKSHAPGSILNYVIKSTNEVYFSNMKSLFLALYATSEAEFNALDEEEAAEMLEMAFGEQQTCVGRVVIADAIQATAKKIKAGATEPSQYTRIRWFADEDENAEAAA
jgi:hypothetical protein